MSVKIRLTRIGRHEDPFYRVVVSDSRSARDKKNIEELGYYNPKLGKESLVLNEERVLYWLSNGAKPSDTVKSLLNSKGLNEKFAASKVKKSSKPKASKAATFNKKPEEETKTEEVKKPAKKAPTLKK